MLFVTIEYFVFFLAILALFYTLPGRYRKLLLLAASYLFYASWNWKFVPLLAALTVIDFFAAGWISTSMGTRRRVALLISLTANLSFLAFFKYYNFATSNIAAVMGLPANSFYLSIILPLGISFHTFQSISYVVDVYRGKQEAIRSLLDYALFISFFPQLVAGPIVRARTFFADLYGWRAPETAEIKRGAFLIMMGLAKKLVLADNFAVVSDSYFGSIGTHPGSIAAWGGIISFAVEIFFDFSGYTDMAIGCALLLGFHFPQNFAQPFLSISVTDFWRRWHISLSSWLRDYLYIPLGGSRHGAWNTYRNLFLTMLLGGLWHGAKWGFVAWGAYNGLLLAVERFAHVNKIRERPLRVSDLPLVILNFAIFCVGVVFVRANSLSDAFTVIRRMFERPAGRWPIETALAVLLAVSTIVALLEDRGLIRPRVERSPAWALGTLLGCLLFVVEIFSPDATRPFYYFQF